MTNAKLHKKVLVAPLDWGLGHATRCIPVIEGLLQKGVDVTIATSGSPEKLLKAEFPNLPFLHLPGYGIYYGKNGVMWQLLRQIPGIRRHIWTEHAWLLQAIRQHGFSGVISDNRYGLCSSRIPSVLISHQLNLQMPAWSLMARPLVQKVLYQHISPFGECWVPDLDVATDSLAGRLSHPKKLPSLPVHHIGWLSRFKQPEIMPPREKVLLICLSGPEPQRSMLEAKIMQQIQDIHQPVWLVRGLPGEPVLPPVPAHVTVYNHLNTKELQDLMVRCNLMICRSGYSSLMDAFTLQTPIACIPTPGQTEQEYLAQRLEEQGMASMQQQENLNLKALVEAGTKQGTKKQRDVPVSRLSENLDRWLATL